MVTTPTNTDARGPIEPINPVTEAIDTIDALINRAVGLAGDIARLRQELEDLRHEQKLREAHFVLNGLQGRNEQERMASLTMLKHADADFRRLTEDERSARLKLAELEAQIWAARQKLAVSVVLLRLATQALAEGSPQDGPGAESEGAWGPFDA